MQLIPSLATAHALGLSSDGPPEGPRRDVSPETLECQVRSPVCFCTRPLVGDSYVQEYRGWRGETGESSLCPHTPLILHETPLWE